MVKQIWFFFGREFKTDFMVYDDDIGLIINRQQEKKNKMWESVKIGSSLIYRKLIRDLLRLYNAFSG